MIRTAKSTTRIQTKRKFRITREDKSGWLFSAPLVVGVLGLAFYPMIAALLLSMQQVNGAVLSGKWVGFRNYTYVVNDYMFWRALGNTFYMGVLSVAFGIVFSFILATLINGVISTGFKNLFKAIYFLPNVISAVATTMLFSFLFYPTKDGVLNAALAMFHISPVGWFTDPSVARISIVIMSLWGALGYNTIIFLAGLQSVPRDLFEAAEVDGASRFRRWVHITIPYLRPIFVFMIVMGVIGSMKRFTDVWVIGGSSGNPGGSLLTSVLYIYRNAFLANQMGIATAASYLLFVVILLLTLVLLKLNGKKSQIY